MSSISHVPQNIYLVDGSFKENIAFGLKNDSISLSRVKEAAKKAQIHDFIASTENGYLTNIGERGVKLSGGQIQRIGIARALALNPKFIICDESVSALDVSVQAQVLNLLNDLKKEFGLTYIFISHDLSVVKYMSDRMVVMQGGKIEEMGDADQIYNSPQTAYTKKLIDAVPEGKTEDIKKK